MEGEQKEAWAKIHAMLEANLKTCHFNWKKKTLVIADAASKLGIGAVLAQVNADGTRSLIACCSRALGDSETRYSATEAELLAVVYAFRKFHLYLTQLSSWLVRGINETI